MLFLVRSVTRFRCSNSIRLATAATTRTHFTCSASNAATAARVRFAPSPTGYLHLGGLRTALFNYFLARKTGGQFILRIEDTDQNRFVEGAVENLLKVLDWAGISYDEGPNKEGPYTPYYQSKRTDIYVQYAHQLLSSGHAYRCFCTPERLAQVKEMRQKNGNFISYDKHCSFLSEEEIRQNLERNLPYTVRLRIPYEGVTEHQDLVYGKIKFSNKTIDDTILLKSDGYPTYHLANVVDDHLMKITHVLRGEEWLSSTSKHLLLYKAFGWQPPQFAHLPLLFKAQGTKLSKRTGDAHVEDYIEKGYLPEAVNNFVALLGWNPNTDDEGLFTMDEMIEKFDIKDINHSGAIVDQQKLDWVNKHHLLKRAETPEGMDSLVDILKTPVHEQYQGLLKGTNDEYRLNRSYLKKVINTVKERIRNISDIPRLCYYFFKEPDYETKDAIALRKKVKQPALDLVLSNEFSDKLKTLDAFEAKIIKPWLISLAENHNLNVNHIMMAIRYCITGTQVGAGIAETMETLGRETVSQRLQQLQIK
ncbi:glutamyl-tRNA synthetase [Mycotypha africana]|uniref:glutamyl-tRNA synthetase n=1 Tax=Mycotypha africana TaxID=64632 RepID=UPI002300C5B5|nr:glutamyl-tRNA synthetase [Mycotypha africana]KAI8990920.1 glutamyl-tRNA synthetase [Mycotypha africana]